MATKRVRYINAQDEKFTISSTGERVTFYHFDDNTYDFTKHTRVKWVDCIGFEYVRLNNTFYAISMQPLYEGMKITVGEYRQ